MKIVGESHDAASTLTLAKKHKPAVALMDAALPGGAGYYLYAKQQDVAPLNNPTASGVPIANTS